MGDWERISLAEAGVTLIDCVHKTPEARDSGYPYVTIPEMKNGTIDFANARKIDQHDFIEWTKKAKPEEDDVIVSRRTNPGVTATFGKDIEFALGQNLVLLRANGRRVLPKFLKWLARGPEWWNEVGRFNNVGAVFDSLKCADIPKFQLHVPPIAHQTSIANVLSSLDDKIELNRQMTQTLEGMAAAIFREWFVDFGPVRRKLEGATDPVIILGGLILDPARAAELVASFPNVLDNNGLPLGWSEEPLDKIADFLNGLALQKFPANVGEPFLPVIKIAQLRRGIDSGCDRASRNVPSKYVVKDGDYLFSWSGSLMAKVWSEGEGALNQHLFKVTSDRFPQWFYAGWVQHHLAEFQVIAASKATTMGHIQRGHLKSAMTVCPDIPCMAAMDHFMYPMWRKKLQNDLENRTLAETRDYLLPRLMSGKVRVADAERLAG